MKNVCSHSITIHFLPWQAISDDTALTRVYWNAGRPQSAGHIMNHECDLVSSLCLQSSFFMSAYMHNFKTFQNWKSMVYMILIITYIFMSAKFQCSLLKLLETERSYYVCFYGMHIIGFWPWLETKHNSYIQTI